VVAVAHAVCAGIGLAPLPRLIFEDPMFKDALRPVLVKYPAQARHLYALYVSRKHLPAQDTHLPRSVDRKNPHSHSRGRDPATSSGDARAMELPVAALDPGE